MKQLIPAVRVIFGVWMLANGANHFFFSLWPLPTGHEPLAMQLMASFVHSELINVAMAIELIAGALILAGFFVPVALCVLMPVSTCALYWSAVLDHQPLGALVALVAFALNGVLMLAYIDYYRGAMQRYALTLGEAPGEQAIFDLQFVKLSGRSSRAQFIAALITLLAVVVFYVWLVPGRSGLWSIAVLLFPGIILHARRLHDMGRTAWLLIAPAALMFAAFAIWLKIVSLGAQLDGVVPLVAIAAAAGFALWGCIGKGQAEGNRFGSPVAT